jgi:hypothetical protein
MRFRPVGSAVLIVLLAGIAAAGSAFAGASLAAFNAAAERASAHNRVALGYLRTGNTDLAMLELERLRAAWAALVKEFAANRPDVFDQTLYTATLTEISTRLAAADMLAQSGRPEAALTSLTGVRDALSQLRRKSGVEVLADCVMDAGAAMTTLGAFDQQPLDWSRAETGATIEAASTAFGKTIARCDAMASAEVKASPEFRRLIDGAQASLALVPKAIATRDSDLFHRVVIELRAFDNLLAFRFG